MAAVHMQCETHIAGQQRNAQALNQRVRCVVSVHNLPMTTTRVTSKDKISAEAGQV